jgi:hypothetical protein
MTTAAEKLIRERVADAGYRYSVLLLQSQWESFTKNDLLPQTNWEEAFFNSQNRKRIPTTAGIYAFAARPKVAAHNDHVYMMYVGKTKNLRKRFGQYLQEKKNPRRSREITFFLNEYESCLWFTYKQVAEQYHAEIELPLIRAMWPLVNEAGKALATPLHEKARTAF